MAQAEREQALEAIRVKALQDTDKIAGTQRFGLFTQQAPLAIGDTMFKHTLPPRDENGKVKIEPKNMSIKAPMTGKSKSSYFSMMGFATIGDPYIEQEKLQRQQEMKAKSASQDAVFKPASFYKTIIKSTYEHKTDYLEKPKNYKDADGKVITEPKNINSCIHAKGVFLPLPHLPEPYDRPRQFAKKEREAHQAQMKDKANFKTTSHGDQNFSNVQQAFGFQGTIPPKKVKEFKPNIFEHDNPFKPSNPPKSGMQGYLGQYPEYKGNPIRQVVRIDNVKGKDTFKINSPSIIDRPTPSITMHPQNIRKEMMSSALFK